MVLDRLSGLVREEFVEVAQYVDVVEIGWGLPLIWKEEAVKSRTKYFKELDIRVSMSGTLLEHALFRGTEEAMLKRASSLGFDMVEISDGILDLTIQQKAELAKRAKLHGLDFIYAVGKKDPAAQLSPSEVLDQVTAGLELSPFKVVIEGRERGRGVGIYDGLGNVRWPLLHAIVSHFDQTGIIFEAPSEVQQAALIQELGPEVNLGNVSLASVATLQSERLGLRFDTFGVDRPAGELAGGPSIKFVLFVIRQYQPIDQKEIVRLTQLPKRTVQKAVERLLAQKLITEHPNFEDKRSKIYRTSSASPMNWRVGQEPHQPAG